MLDLLRDKAARLRIHSIRETSAAGSGHPTSCASAAEIVATLFFSVMRYDPANPGNLANDAFVLSKGHAAPLLYAALAEAGIIGAEELPNLRKFSSRLEGHPTPRIPFVPVATGSLGQGLPAGVGIAISSKFLRLSDERVYVLLGDGESMEGSVWEAAAIAAAYDLSNLCATIDVNGLGQSEPTLLGHGMETYRNRWESFGWRALVVDGHDLNALLAAYGEAEATSDRPTVILARTIKGKGIPAAEGKEGFHGKPLSEEDAEAALTLLSNDLRDSNGLPHPLPAANGAPPAQDGPARLADPPYEPGSQTIATRQAFGDALAALGKADKRIVVVDGDVKNSTGTQTFEKEFPDRFFQMYIAEQNMAGVAMGLASRGWVPFAATFACFLSRAYDFARMAAVSGSNVKFVGSHAGVSIGEDGPSQMGLEDLAMFCAEPSYMVLYPCDAVSAWRATELIANHRGPAYLRTTRPKTPVIYEPDEVFEAGKCKVLREAEGDQVTVVAAGITVFEALKAYQQLRDSGIGITVVDLFSVQPIDAEALALCARKTAGRIVTVEDHYLHGGIGDAVARAVAPWEIAVQRMGVDAIPHSGEESELLDHFRISAAHIVKTVKRMIESPGAGRRARDEVDEASMESFPASDPPAWSSLHA